MYVRPSLSAQDAINWHQVARAPHQEELEKFINTASDKWMIPKSLRFLKDRIRVECETTVKRDSLGFESRKWKF